MPVDLPVDEAWVIIKEDTQVLELATTLGVDSAGGLLDERLDPAIDNAWVGGSWSRLMDEFYKCLCEDDPSYRELREKANQAKAAGTVLGVPAIAAYLADHLHMTPAVVLPFVALAIASAVRFGTNAWCAQQTDVRAANATPTPVTPPP